MKKIYTLLLSVIITGGLFAQVTSSALGGSCKNSDDGTLEIRWNALLNCPDQDVVGIENFGFHSAAEDWGVFEVLWDDASAATAVRNPGDTAELTLNTFDYYGIAVTDMTVLKFLFNDGADNAAAAWDKSGRDTVLEDGAFGLGCADLYIDMTTLQECFVEDTMVNGLQHTEAVDFLDAYPNPAQESITLNFPNYSQEEFEIYVSNSIGQIVNTAYTRDNNAVFQRNNLAAGLYLATLIDKQGNRSTVQFQFH
ncbi:MAG: hypothetical protein ACI959_002186 [Limisphaerales bacterium]|jgi:hypothetical protein